MKKLLVFLIFPLLTGCSATMESHLSKNTPYAPVNEINGGIVSYLNQGAQFVKDSRRKDAYKKMHDACQGDYKILSEGESAEEGIATPIGNSVLYGQDRYWKIKFECVH